MSRSRAAAAIVLALAASAGGAPTLATDDAAAPKQEPSGRSASAAATAHAPVPAPATARAPVPAAAAAARVRAMYFARDFEGAIAEGGRLAGKFPESGELRAWLILSIARQRTETEAAAEAEKLIASNPDDPWGLFAFAGTCMGEDERTADCLRASRKALARLPGHPDALWMRASTLATQGRKERAIAFVDRHRTEVPNPADLLVVKAQAQLDLAGWDPPDEAKLAEAMETFDAARSADPRNVDAHYLPGLHLSIFLDRHAEGYPLLKQAAALAPYANRIHEYYWRAALALQGVDRGRKRAEVEADMNRLLRARADAPGALAVVARQYREMKATARQREIEARLLRRFPASREAEWILSQRWRDLAQEARGRIGKDPKPTAEYRRMLEEFIARPQHLNEALLGEAYLNLLHRIKDDPAVSADRLLEIARATVKYDKYNPHATYPLAAIALADRQAHFREAEAIARAGFEAAEAYVDEQRDWYDTPEEYGGALDRLRGLMHDGLGWVFFNEGRLEEAEKELLVARALGPHERDNLHHLGRLYEAKGDPGAAEAWYLKGLEVELPSENPCAAALKELYFKRYATMHGFETYWAKVTGDDRSRRRERVLAARLAGPETVPEFALKTLDGASVALADLKGKVVAINFWGLWCGWCLEEMPDVQKLHEQYRGHPEVRVLTIDHNDSPDKVRDWMRDKRYDFPVLLDDGYVSARARIDGFPTTWFLDRNGRKAFEEIGWSKHLVEEFGWRIEALREGGGASAGGEP
jgi:thiol-disulfide isomerase/thioredoxin